MLAKLHAATEDEEGFTLIELLVVILIIGILSAIAIPVFLSQKKKATEASVKSDLRAVATAMETYYVDNLTYPSVSDSPGTITVGSEVIKLSSGNIAATTTDGAWAQPGGYCLAVYNNEIGGAAEAYYYSSTQGGMLPKGQPCDPAV